MQRFPISSGRRLPRLAATLAALGLIGLGATPALAAGTFFSDCEDREGEREDAAIPDALDLTHVDLTSEAEMPELDELPELDEEMAARSSTPLLYLGPRVASIVADIFGAGDSDGETETPPTLSPVANSPASVDEAEADATRDAALGDRPYSPLRIHREMYRTDI